MAFDGLAISCIRHELREKCIGGRVDKINQPEHDEIIISIRCGGENLRLIASSSSSNPRVHLTETQKENPVKAPMFCMLLRKHLSSGKIVGFEQPNFERVLEILIESRNELGDISVKHLFVEIMGRHSNIILTDKNKKILGSIKHIDFSVSSVRQVIPGMLYEPPPSQGKTNPYETDKEKILKLINSFEGSADKFILDTYTGIGPMSARELAFSSLGDWEASLPSLKLNQKTQFAKDIALSFENFKNGKFFPVILFKSKQKIWEFSSINITQYGNGVIVKPIDSLNKAADEFFETRDFQDRILQKTSDLLKFVDNNIKRCQKKLALQQQKLKDCQNKEQDKEYGDLIIANLHLIKDNASEIEVQNFYNNMNLLTIKLKPELSPSQNAQRYYTLYQKAKNAEVMTNKQIKLTENELDYLESVQDSILRAESEKEINEIRNELAEQGYNVRRHKASKIRKETPSKPEKYVLSDNFEVNIGKNNLQNDELTLRMSNAYDIWLHTKNIPGSHTVISTKGRTPSDDVIVEAAKLCAYHSKAKNSSNVPVDYTIIKNVKKPKGAKPGMVIYENYKTVNVKPCSFEELILIPNKRVDK